MRRYIVEEYTHEDCEEYKKNLDVAEVIRRLDSIEERWIGSRPNVAYLEYETCSAGEFEKYKDCVALDKAAKLLSEMLKKGEN